ncbi:hypothetical protein MG293_000464 [Ovis ammon polii]|uniref:Uncharacterized protein n=1 Tax=Ovis ammon polii TaxID=230172 RepID=A0AAD4UQ44_OVIAM|nr:hypothetical protein MG293_000464 [Ovis ammon polii]
MEKNEFSLPANEDIPTEETNNKNQISNIECEEYLYLSDNELDLGDKNNDDSITDVRKRFNICFLLYIFVKCAKSLQSSLTLCSPMDRRPPGSSVQGILQVERGKGVQNGGGYKISKGKARENGIKEGPRTGVRTSASLPEITEKSMEQNSAVSAYSQMPPPYSHLILRQFLSMDFIPVLVILDPIDDYIGYLLLKVTQSCQTLCDPMESSPWNSPGQVNKLRHVVRVQQGYIKLQPTTENITHP